MSNNHKASHSEKLTKELALQFAQMDHLPGERRLNTGHLNSIKGWLAEKSFSAPIWSKGFCREDKKWYRLDGQHTSKLLSELEGEFPDLTVTIVDWEFDSVTADAPRLFDLFNNPISNRTDLDKLSIYRSGYDDLDEIEHKFLERVLKGIRFYQTKILKKPHVPKAREKGVLLNDEANRNLARWLWKFHGAKHAWLLAIDGVTGEICNDYRESVKLAEEFWQFVLLENHPDVDHPTRELSAKLRDWKRSDKKISVDRYYKETKKIWDRYRRLRDLELNRPGPLEASAPIASINIEKRGAAEVRV